LLLILLSICIFSNAYAQSRSDNAAFERIVKTGTIRCGFIPWPPGFEIEPNTGEVKGPTKELFESILGLTGWNVEFIEVSLTTDILELNKGTIDAMCASGPWTITNVKHVDYTTPVAYSPVHVYLRKDESRFSSFEDLNRKNVTFAGIDGDISIDLAGHRFPKAKTRALINLTDPAQLLMELADGKADAVILDPVTAESFMKNNPGRIRQLDIGENLAVYPVGMAVRWGEYKLSQALSRASEMAINTGLVDRLLDLYDPDRVIVYNPDSYYVRPERK
jgi:ABC-type amino acid transport substrate-binding protein